MYITGYKSLYRMSGRSSHVSNHGNMYITGYKSLYRMSGRSGSASNHGNMYITDYKKQLVTMSGRSSRVSNHGNMEDSRFVYRAGLGGIPGHQRTHLMYYLHCACSVLELDEDPTINRLNMSVCVFMCLSVCVCLYCLSVIGQSLGIPQSH